MLFLLPVALLYFAWWARRKQRGLRYSDLSLVVGLPRGRTAFARAIRTSWRLIAINCLIIAAAGPNCPDLKTRLPAEGVAIVAAVDVSGSMGEEDFAWITSASASTKPISRLATAKRVLTLFVQGGGTSDGPPFEGRPNDSMGIVSFAAWPEAACPLTLNHSVFLKVLSQLSPKVGPDAGTNIGDAIAESLIRLDAAGAGRKVLILISDGEHNIALDRADPPLKPRQAAQLAADLKIPIYTIDCGGDGKGDADAIARRLEGRAILQSVAEMTNGKSFIANDGEQLRSACLEIDQLERKPAESFTYRRSRDLSVWFASVGLISLIVGLFFALGLWRTFP
ncbi:MAG: VWA domain-containing protein [Gemmataceae bacterium]